MRAHSFALCCSFHVIREANQDLLLGGFLVKKGTMVWMPFYAIHNSHINFSNPEDFDPERWRAFEGQTPAAAATAGARDAPVKCTAAPPTAAATATATIAPAAAGSGAGSTACGKASDTTSDVPLECSVSCACPYSAQYHLYQIVYQIVYQVCVISIICIKCVPLQCSVSSVTSAVSSAVSNSVSSSASSVASVSKCVPLTRSCCLSCVCVFVCVACVCVRVCVCEL